MSVLQPRETRDKEAGDLLTLPRIVACLNHAHRVQRRRGFVQYIEGSISACRYCEDRQLRLLILFWFRFLRLPPTNPLLLTTSHLRRMNRNEAMSS